MTTRDEVLAKFDKWSDERERLSEMEGEADYPSSGQWEASDDEGIDLLWQMADLLRGQR